MITCPSRFSRWTRAAAVATSLLSPLSAAAQALDEGAAPTLSQLDLIANELNNAATTGRDETLSRIYDIIQAAQQDALGPRSFTAVPMASWADVLREPVSLDKTQPTDAVATDTGTVQETPKLVAAAPEAAHEEHDDHGHEEMAASAIPCVAELQLMVQRTHIYFDIGSYRVDTRGKSSARLIAARAQACPEARVNIIGFTDPGGPDDLNLLLSWQRVNNVLAAIKLAGFDTDRMEVQSHMEEHPEGCVHFEGIDRRVIFEVVQAQAS